MKLKTKAQSVTEYAILLGVAIAVFAGMQTYVKRGLNARIKKATDASTSAGEGFTIALTGQPELNASYDALGQYEPYYQYSQSDSYSESVMQEHTGEGQLQKEIVSDVNVQAAGAIRGDISGAQAAADGDTQWGDVGD